ncbi:MAG: hypothetical protein RLZZ236_1999 [Bacteroidota bacterium]|jgi:hypothetical protein
MISRDEFISQFRGNSLGRIDIQSSGEEEFQNKTLRPILKLQNELILQIFNNYLTQNKIHFSNLSIDKKMNTIENTIAKDSSLQNTYKGIIIAFFTIDEYQLYSTFSSGINKRIRTMLIERIQSQLQLL